MIFPSKQEKFCHKTKWNVVCNNLDPIRSSGPTPTLCSPKWINTNHILQDTWQPNFAPHGIKSTVVQNLIFFRSIFILFYIYCYERIIICFWLVTFSLIVVWQCSVIGNPQNNPGEVLYAMISPLVCFLEWLHHYHSNPNMWRRGWVLIQQHNKPRNSIHGTILYNVSHIFWTSKITYYDTMLLSWCYPDAAYIVVILWLLQG